MISEDLRIGVFVCDCGSNIGGIVDTEMLREYAATLPNVVVAVRNKYTCADPGQQEIQRTIYEYNLNRVVVASCSPASTTSVTNRFLLPCCFSFINAALPGKSCGLSSLTNRSSPASNSE